MYAIVKNFAHEVKPTNAMAAKALYKNFGEAMYEMVGREKGTSKPTRSNPPRNRVSHISVLFSSSFFT